MGEAEKVVRPQARHLAQELARERRRERDVRQALGDGSAPAGEPPPGCAVGAKGCRRAVAVARQAGAGAVGAGMGAVVESLAPPETGVFELQRPKRGADGGEGEE